MPAQTLTESFHYHFRDRGEQDWTATHPTHATRKGANAHMRGNLLAFDGTREGRVVRTAVEVVSLSKPI